jgi:hypothetical protein
MHHHPIAMDRFTDTPLDTYSDATKETSVFESSTAPLEGHFHGSEKPGLFCWITVAV